MSSLMERTRPAGYNKKFWEYCYAEAEKEKAWAKDVCLNSPQWFHEASDMSIQMLGKALHKAASDLAKESYDYLYMRACGQTFIGPLDSPAREKWESVTGKKIGAKSQWKYDHTQNFTSAKREGKGWVSRFDNKARAA